MYVHRSMTKNHTKWIFKSININTKICRDDNSKQVNYKIKPKKTYLQKKIKCKK